MYFIHTCTTINNFVDSSDSISLTLETFYVFTQQKKNIKQYLRAKNQIYWICPQNKAGNLVQNRFNQ